jgi:hypothetical protein
MQDANEIFMVRKQIEIKEMLRHTLNFIDMDDDLNVKLFKFHTTIAGIAWNF